MRLLLLHHTDHDVPAIEAEVARSGHRVRSISAQGTSLLREVEVFEPDVIIVAADDPSRDLLEQVCVFSQFRERRIDALHPRLARLLDVRWQIGVRSTPHTLAKLLLPAPAAWRALPVTHADDLVRLARHLQAAGGRGIVYRGCEGEAHWHPRRDVLAHVCRDGVIDIRPWSDGSTADAIETVDPEATRRSIEAVIAEEQPMPPAIAAQADLMMELVHATH